MPRDRRRQRQGGAAEITDEQRKVADAAAVLRAERADVLATEAETAAAVQPTPAGLLHARTLRANATTFAADLAKSKPKRRRE